MKVFLIIDMQNDFMPGAVLGIASANEIIPIINALISKFSFVVATKDWHPLNHVSFASSHAGKKIGDMISISGIDQILWPVHCVHNTRGADFVSSLDVTNFAATFYKGTDKDIDSYSAFFDNARRKSTGLGDYLKNRGINEIYLGGLATDYCVLYSAIDAIDLGFTVNVIADACRPINLKPDDEQRAFETMTARGARIITSLSLINFGRPLEQF